MSLAAVLSSFPDAIRIRQTLLLSKGFTQLQCFNVETLGQWELKVAVHMTFTVQKHRMGVSYQLLSLLYTIQDSHLGSDLSYS